MELTPLTARFCICCWKSICNQFGYYGNSPQTTGFSGEKCIFLQKNALPAEKCRFSEQPPCRSAEVKFFSVFLCRRCREIWREILVKFSVLRFPGFGCATENFTKMSRQKRGGGVKNGKFHANFTLLGRSAEDLGGTWQENREGFGAPESRALANFHKKSGGPFCSSTGNECCTNGCQLRNVNHSATNTAYEDPCLCFGEDVLERGRGVTERGGNGSENFSALLSTFLTISNKKSYSKYLWNLWKSLKISETLSELLGRCPSVRYPSTSLRMWPPTNANDSNLIGGSQKGGCSPAPKCPPWWLKRYTLPPIEL